MYYAVISLVAAVSAIKRELAYVKSALHFTNVPYNSTKTPYFFFYILQKSPIFPPISITFLQKSPTFTPKGPIFPKKNLEVMAHTMSNAFISLVAAVSAIKIELEYV